MLTVQLSALSDFMKDIENAIGAGHPFTIEMSELSAKKMGSIERFLESYRGGSSDVFTLTLMRDAWAARDLATCIGMANEKGYYFEYDGARMRFYKPKTG